MYATLIKLLIVDDDEVMRKLINMSVTKNFPGIEIVGEAANGKEAIEIFKKTDPDIVTMDISMPVMDGVTSMQEMLKINRGTRVLIVSALESRELSAEVVAKGARGFVSKPVRPKALAQAFERYFGIENPTASS